MTLTACSNGGGPVVTGDGGGAGGYESSATGTVSATGVSGTFAGVVYFAGSDFAIVADDGGLTFTSPAGVTSAQLVSTLALGGAPAVGTYFAGKTDSSCGELSLDWATASSSDAYAASACVNGSDAISGNWSLSLTSAELASTASDAGATTSYYWVHGTLHATLVGDLPDAGTVDLGLSF